MKRLFSFYTPLLGISLLFYVDFFVITVAVPVITALSVKDRGMLLRTYGDVILNEALNVFFFLFYCN
jgi:hypothetical protein